MLDHPFGRAEYSRGWMGVLYGWTGLRLTDAGLKPVYPPLLPSRVERLELGGLHVRGRLRDIVVEGSTLR